MKKIVALLLSLALSLTACSSEKKIESRFVPSNCEDTKILASLPSSIPNPKFIDTQWEPAEGTDLYAVIAAGGIACSFGIQEAEIGTTILWANDDSNLFNERSVQWIKDGEEVVDIPEFNEEKAYALSEAKEGSTEKHLWKVNFLISGFWIQISATFADSLEDYTPLAKAAFDSLRDQKTADFENISGCYVAEVGADRIAIKLDQRDRNIVSAKLFFGWTEKESSSGFMFGDYHNGRLSGAYQSSRNGQKVSENVTFTGDKNGFILTSDGAVKEYKLVPSTKCAELLNSQRSNPLLNFIWMTWQCCT